MICREISELRQTERWLLKVFHTTFERLHAHWESISLFVRL
jgi:hypothetical protein